MSQNNKILACIQILVIACLLVCNDGTALRSTGKSNVFPCKGHQCGCKSEYGCKTHCCCTAQENKNNIQINNYEQKNSFGVFVSSVNCKYGKDSFASLTIIVKFMLINQVLPIEESFLCFLSNVSSTHLPEVIVSPPEKPPRHFA